MGFREFRRRIDFLFHRDELASNLNDEMRLHVELRARKLQERGMPESDAAWAARRQFGNQAVAQDASFGTWGFAAWERLVQDLRIGGRALRKSPGFTAVAVLTLALGLGMNTAVFSVVNTVMLRALPYPYPQQLVSLWEEQTKIDNASFSSSGAIVGGKGSAGRTTVATANLNDYRAGCPAFSGIAAFSGFQMNLTGNAEPERLTGEYVTPNFFTVLGVKPAMGREFLPSEDGPDAHVVIVSHDLWQHRLGADTDVLAHTLVLDQRHYQIIGVLPPNFRSPAGLVIPNGDQFFIPIALPKAITASRGNHDLSAIARLQPGATIETARAQLALVNANLAKQYPTTNANFPAAIAPLQDDLVRGVRDSLVALLGASALIVLITCVNVANLLLVRMVGRRRETSVRFALGASRFRVMRQFLTESMIVAAAGCVAGIFLGRFLLRALLALAPPGIVPVDGVSMDWRVFATATAIATLTGILFGLAPAWHASDASPAESLKSTGLTTGGRSQVRWRTALTVAELALSMILLVGAGLLLKSFVLLMGVDLGFQPDRVIAMNINLPDAHYGASDGRLRFYQQLEERVRALPGVLSVTYANRMPMRGSWRTGIQIDSTGDTNYTVDSQTVSPGYFETLGIGLRHGRLFTADDRRNRPNVAIVNEAFARQFLHGEDPVERHVRRGGQGQWMTIVGVTGDIRRAGKTDRINPELYIPAAQNDSPVQLADFAVRTAGDPRQLFRAIQQQVFSLDKDQPVTTVRTLEETISASVAQRRFQTTLLMIFAAVAVALAVIGIFGVLSYAVGQRIGEIGIRIALGARPGSILTLVLKQAGGLIAAGIAIGAAGALALTAYLTSMLFGIKPTNWIPYAAAALLLAVVSLIAALVPAGRGARVDPIVALRQE